MFIYPGTWENKTLIEMTLYQMAWFWVGKSLCAGCVGRCEPDSPRFCVVDPSTKKYLAHSVWPSCPEHPENLRQGRPGRRGERSLYCPSILGTSKTGGNLWCKGIIPNPSRAPRAGFRW